MAFYFVNLDDQTRRFMLEEVERDVAANKLYLSPRLSPQGLADFPSLLRQAAASGDDTTLAATLRGSGRMNRTFERKKRSGGITNVTMPVNAPEMLAEGEFNRFYARGLCLRAIADGIKEVVVYRAKQVANPRPESEAKIGMRVDALAFLEDLRTHQGIEPALGIPQPNSGLSVKLP